MLKSLLIFIQKTNVTFFFSLFLPSINLKVVGTHKHKHEDTCVHTHKGILCNVCLSHSFHTYFKTSFLLITNGPLTGDPVSHWSAVIAASVPWPHHTDYVDCFQKKKEVVYRMGEDLCHVSIQEHTKKTFKNLSHRAKNSFNKWENNLSRHVSKENPQTVSKCVESAQHL